MCKHYPFVFLESKYENKQVQPKLHHVILSFLCFQSKVSPSPPTTLPPAAHSGLGAVPQHDKLLPPPAPAGASTLQTPVWLSPSCPSDLLVTLSGRPSQITGQKTVPSLPTPLSFLSYTASPFTASPLPPPGRSFTGVGTLTHRLPCTSPRTGNAE